MHSPAHFPGPSGLEISFSISGFEEGGPPLMGMFPIPAGGEGEEVVSGTRPAERARRVGHKRCRLCGR